MLEKIRWSKIVAKRFLRRLKYLFDPEIITWEYESCNNCGRCYRLACDWEDYIWLKVVGSDSGCLCPDCFLKIAQEKGIFVDIDIMAKLWQFNPNEMSNNMPPMNTKIKKFSLSSKVKNDIKNLATKKISKKQVKELLKKLEIEKHSKIEVKIIKKENIK